MLGSSDDLRQRGRRLTAILQSAEKRNHRPRTQTQIQWQNPLHIHTRRKKPTPSKPLHLLPSPVMSIHLTPKSIPLNLNLNTPKLVKIKKTHRRNRPIHGLGKETYSQKTSAEWSPIRLTDIWDHNKKDHGPHSGNSTPWMEK